MAWEFIDGMGHSDIFILFLFIGYTCLLRVMFTPAGYIRSYVVVNDNEKLTTNQENFLDTFSYKKFLRPIHSHWSRRTRRMVMDYDHFCEWTYNDIGLNNYRFFAQFILWTLVNCICVLALCVKLLYGCMGQWDYFSCTMIHNHKPIVIGIYFITLLGSIFLMNMMYDVYLTITTGWGAVDRAKGAQSISRNNVWTLYFTHSHIIGLFYALLPLPNDARIAHRKDMMERKCGKCFEKVGLNVVYK